MEKLPLTTCLSGFLFEHRPKRFSRSSLCLLLSCSDRHLREAKAELVRQGYPIGASCEAPGGYYWIIDQVQLWEAYDQHHSRLIAHARAMAGLQQALPELPDVGQTVLDLVGEE